MRYHVTVLCLGCLAGSLTAADPATPTAARQRLLRGNTAEARELYAELAKEPAQRAAAAIGTSRCWECEGEYDKALSAIDDAIKTDAQNLDLLARRAELLHYRGRWDDALAAAGQVIEKQDDHFLARWVRAQINRDQGDLVKADAEFRWFVRTYTARNRAGRDIKDPDQLLLIAQAGSENARWHQLNDQFQFILNEVYADALKLDADLWPAEYQAGLLLLEKYNKAEALAAFDKALKINPRAAEALFGKGLLAFQHFELKEAEQYAGRALEINPRLPEALRLAADIHIGAGEYARALVRLEKAREVNPRDEATLGRIAAVYLLARDRAADFDRLSAEVQKFDAKPGRFYLELAARLDDRRWYDQAQGYYRKALELRPHLHAARNHLGLLAMRMGQETEARRLLEEAFKADVFNVRVANSIKVLRHLDKYETIQTAHFHLRFDPKTDAVLGRFMADSLEDIYKRLAEAYGYKPAGPILIEVFNSHEMFSGRVIATPDLHTVGASTGRMAAMVSPKGQGVKKAFNWGRVIRHELVHIFNLEQTQFQVPHWLTEGLAVENEGFPRPHVWVQVLSERAGDDTLLNLSTIDAAFIRPRSPDEWALAYCQAQLYAQYLSHAHGPKAVTEMLTAYRDGKSTPAAIRQVCGVEIDAFEKGYKAHVRGLVQKLKGKPPEKAMTLAELEAARAKAPDDADLTARLAEQYLKRRRNREARELADTVLDTNAKHGLALYVKAQLLQNAGEEDLALRLLESAAAAEPPDPRVLRALGRLHFDAGRAEEAAALFEKGRAAEPTEPGWLDELAKVYKHLEENEKRLAVLQDLAPLNPDDIDIRREMAEAFVAAKKYPIAERWAREALEIDAGDAVAQSAFLMALEGQNKSDAAAKYRKIFGRGT